MYEPARATVQAIDHRAGILGIAALSGPSNLSRSQWTSRTALPTGFKRIPPTAGGKYRSALFDRCTRPLVSRTSPHIANGNGVYSGGIRLSFQYNDQYSLLPYYKIVFLPWAMAGSSRSPSFGNKLPGYCSSSIVREPPGVSSWVSMTRVLLCEMYWATSHKCGWKKL